MKTKLHIQSANVKNKNMRIVLSITLYSLIIGFSYAQESTLIDFGSPNTGYTSTGNWNNVTVNTGDQSGLIVNLINDLGNSTGAILTLDDSFDFYNTVGTTNPNSNLPFLEPATKDSFFGETAPFNGVTNPTGGFTLSNLDPTKYYSFSVFASRISVSDNRETQYTASGQNVVSNTLNASNNTSNTTNILNINPLSNGTISFVVTAGSNNTNPFGFYYLGAIQMITSSTPITNIGSTSLSLVYPNGGEFWEVGKTPYISWDSQNITDVTIEYTIDNGSTWTTLAVVPANTDKYNWTIPNSVSSQCKIKISEGLNTDISDTTFSIIENIGTTYKIVILGSSTAAGTGPSDINNAWVWRYREFLTQVDTRYQIENLAVGGFATYNILPTGTTIPAGISRTIDTEKNVTKAIALNADGIIINLPSNDAASGYSAVDQIANYHLIRNTALTQNIPVWISSPQPRNFGANTTAVNIQLEMVTATPVEFGEYAFDFWTNLGIPPNGNGIIPPYNADGVHMNDAGHLILFERVIAKNIHSIVKNNVDESLSVDLYNFDSFLKIYPNPFKEEVSIKFNQSSGLDIKVSIFDSYGRLVTKILNNESITGDNIIKWNPAKSRIAKGIYLCEIKVGEKTITKKIIFN